MQNGVLLMGGASLLALLYTRGDVATLVACTRSTSSSPSRCRSWRCAGSGGAERRKQADWRRQSCIHVVGLVLCVGILAVNVYEKFREGGWVTLVVTGAVVGRLLLDPRATTAKVQQNLRRLDDILAVMPKATTPARPLDPSKPTAALLVGSYAGLGVHSLLTIQRLFPGYFKNFVFLSVGVIDSATFKDIAEVVEVQASAPAARSTSTWRSPRGSGSPPTVPDGARHGSGGGGDPAVPRGGEGVSRGALFFAGKLVFEQERWYQRVLHNETAYQIQRRLQFAGLNAMVLPVRLLEDQAPAKAA